MAKDEIQHGTTPEKRSPAAKHLIEVITGMEHQEVSTHCMKEPKPAQIYIDTSDAKEPHKPNDESELDALAKSLISESPLPYTASAAKVKLYQPEADLIRDLQQLDVMLSMFEPSVSEAIQLHGAWPDH